MSNITEIRPIKHGLTRKGCTGDISLFPLLSFYQRQIHVVSYLPLCASASTFRLKSRLNKQAKYEDHFRQKATDKVLLGKFSHSRPYWKRFSGSYLVLTRPGPYLNEWGESCISIFRDLRGIKNTCLKSRWKTHRSSALQKILSNSYSRYCQIKHVYYLLLHICWFFPPDWK